MIRDLDDSKAPLLDHLIELRRRLLWCVGALLVGVVDTAGRALIPLAFDRWLGAEAAASAGPALASILIYLLMAAVLFWKPRGLFPAHG